MSGPAPSRRTASPHGLPLALENYNLLHRLWREDVVDWDGKFRTPLQGFTSIPRPLDDVPPFVWHGSIRTPEIAEQAAYYDNITGGSPYQDTAAEPPPEYPEL